MPIHHKIRPSADFQGILLYWMPVLLYCILIFIQSGFPSVNPLPASLPQGDKFLHFGGYALLGLLFFRAFRKTLPGKSACLIFFLSIFSSASYGALDEFHQSFVIFRTADLTDFLADLTGSAAGAGFSYFSVIRDNFQENKIAD